MESNVVGRLTPKLSGDMLSTVQFLANRYEATCVRAVVKHRSQGRDSLYALRVHELPADWFTGLQPPVISDPDRREPSTEAEPPLDRTEGEPVQRNCVFALPRSPVSVVHEYRCGQRSQLRGRCVGSICFHALHFPGSPAVAWLDPIGCIRLQRTKPEQRLTLTFPQVRAIFVWWAILGSNQ